MFDHPRLLVVDDEEPICQACRRIFCRQGFQVDQTTDARDGLTRAVENDYAAILLDIKMPEMDGIRFLEELRKTKPDAPVMIMTGYPSIPNAAAAVRLGASDYVTKPFTPEQITQSVRRLLARCGGAPDGSSSSAEPAVESWTAPDGEFLFLDESWVQPEEDGSACLGAVLVCPPAARAEAVELPQVGDVVFQGLPIAGIRMSDESRTIVPSPVSGVVVSVNELLRDEPSRLLTDPCASGWIACICTTRLDDEVKLCTRRRVILASADPASAQAQRDQLTSLGCHVRVVASREEMAAMLPDPHALLQWGSGGWYPGSTVPDLDGALLVLDAASFGRDGLALIRQVNAAAPSLRVVVAASSASGSEAEYREQKIFYYAIEPFADREIVEILDIAFRSQSPPAPPARRKAMPSEPLSGIRVTNHSGHKVQLLAAPRLLRRGEGLGAEILERLHRRALPVATTPGDAEVVPVRVLKAAGTCDRVMVLMALDTGRLPGCLLRDTEAEYVSESKENASRVTTLVVQPDLNGGLLAGLDQRTTAALAKHIVEEMESY
jgi:DNA-binding response OmpR family regulator